MKTVKVVFFVVLAALIMVACRAVEYCNCG